MAVLDDLAVSDTKLDNRAALFRRDFIHQLHGLDDAQHVALFDRIAKRDKGLGVRCGGRVEKTPTIGAVTVTVPSAPSGVCAGTGACCTGSAGETTELPAESLLSSLMVVLPSVISSVDRFISPISFAS